ncbi:MAG: hypothetical protein J6A88_01885 [Oscillospiraceae bacterium]|nr:hypothetical protein [Oscillospiraceae bacterium]
MSGKFAKNNQKAAAKKRKGSGLTAVLTVIALLLALVVGALCLGAFYEPEEAPRIDEPSAPEAQEQLPEETAQSTEAASIEQVETLSVNLGYGLYVQEVGSYTGIYMEDGTDEVVSGILMLVVSNDSELDIQYAEITMDIGEETAQFTLTTLPGGDSVVLLEKNRMAYDKAVDYEAILPAANNVAYFAEELSLQEDQLELKTSDGVINVSNISGEDIDGDIVIYYKNAAQDLYYGGITYRVTLQGGLKAGEMKQSLSNHYSETGSEIMFITISE